MPRTVKVRARIDHTDAATGVPRHAGETYDMPAERGKLKAAQGFVELIGDDDEPIVMSDEERRATLEGARLTPNEKATLEGRPAPPTVATKTTTKKTTTKRKKS